MARKTDTPAPVFVFAKDTCAFRARNGARWVLKKDEAWQADSPIVLERPDLFTDQVPDDPRGRPAGAQSWRVERATRAPGEVRE